MVQRKAARENKGRLPHRSSGARVLVVSLLHVFAARSRESKQQPHLTGLLLNVRAGDFVRGVTAKRHRLGFGGLTDERLCSTGRTAPQAATPNLTAAHNTTPYTPTLHTCIHLDTAVLPAYITCALQNPGLSSAGARTSSAHFSSLIDRTASRPGPHLNYSFPTFIIYMTFS